MSIVFIIELNSTAILDSLTESNTEVAKVQFIHQ